MLTKPVQLRNPNRKRTSPVKSDASDAAIVLDEEPDPMDHEVDLPSMRLFARQPNCNPTRAENASVPNSGPNVR